MGEIVISVVVSNCPRTVPILGETLVRLGQVMKKVVVTMTVGLLLIRGLMLKGKGVLRPRLLLRPTT